MRPPWYWGGGHSANRPTKHCTRRRAPRHYRGRGSGGGWGDNPPWLINTRKQDLAPQSKQMKQDGAEGAGVEGGCNKEQHEGRARDRGRIEEINYLGPRGRLVSCSYQRWEGTRTFSSPPQQLSKARTPERLHTKPLFSVSHLENYETSHRS